MTFDFHPEAEAEFLEAIDYYEQCEESLGQDFAIEVYAALQHIVSYPSAWPVLEGDIRRCLVNRFPYGILYSIEPDRVYVVAVMHLHRDPDYWRDRTPRCQ
jgi:plasmid stabilization system protein ParE